MPFADLSGFERNPDLSAISDLFTVEMITRYIQGKLGGPSQKLGFQFADCRLQI